MFQVLELYLLKILELNFFFFNIFIQKGEEPYKST